MDNFLVTREEIKALLKEQSYMPQKAIVLPCQKKCLNFYESTLTDKE